MVPLAAKIGATQSRAETSLIIVYPGVTAEILKDSANRMAPLDLADALAMIEELCGKALLEGYRGLPRVDKAEIAAVLCAVSQAPVEHPEISEIEINPPRVTRLGPIALDALIVT